MNTFHTLKCELSRLPFNVISTSHGSFSSRAFQNAPFGGMLIVCLAANLGIGGGTIVFEFLKAFFPKQVDFIVMTTTRRWGQLLGQHVQRSSKVVVPFLDTSSTTIVVGGTPGVQTPMPWPLSFPALTNSLRHCLVFLLCVSAHCDLAFLVTLLPSHPALQEGSTSKTVPRKSQSSARKVSLTSQLSVTNLPVASVSMSDLEEPVRDGSL